MFGQVQGPMQEFSSFVDVRDLAKILVWAAMTTEVSDGQRFLCSSYEEGSGQAVADILWKNVPEMVEGSDKGNPGEGYNVDYTATGNFGWANGSKIAKATGFEWIAYEQCVVDSAKSLLHFKNATFSEEVMEIMASIKK